MKDNDESRPFILDTSALIDFSTWLPLDLNRTFWAKMEESLVEGKWILLDVAVGEIQQDNEGLKSWSKEQKRKGLVKTIEESHKNRAIEINSQYKMIDDTTARSTGDTYILSYAEANNLNMFTREKHRKNNDDLYKIPDVCIALKLKFIRRPRIFLEAIGYRN